MDDQLLTITTWSCMFPRRCVCVDGNYPLPGASLTVEFRWADSAISIVSKAEEWTRSSIADTDLLRYALLQG